MATLQSDFLLAVFCERIAHSESKLWIGMESIVSASKRSTGPCQSRDCWWDGIHVASANAERGGEVHGYNFPEQNQSAETWFPHSDRVFQPVIALELGY